MRCLVVTALVSALFGVACTTGTTGGFGDGGPETSSTSGIPGTRIDGGGRGADGGTSTKPPGATDVTCTNGDDCGNWFCDCKDSAGRVTPVNGSTCIDGYCLDAAHTCPRSCQAFGKTWTGTAGGGPRPNAPAQCGGTWFSGACGTCFNENCCDAGKACGANASCASFHDCLATCAGSSCVDQCSDLFPSGTATWNTMAACATSRCSADCE